MPSALIPPLVSCCGPVSHHSSGTLGPKFVCTAPFPFSPRRSALGDDPGAGVVGEDWAWETLLKRKGRSGYGRLPGQEGLQTERTHSMKIVLIALTRQQGRYSADNHWNGHVHCSDTDILL